MIAKNKYFYIIIAIAVIIIIIMYKTFTREVFIEDDFDNEILDTTQDDSKISEEIEKKTLMIYITGAVKKEGIYEMQDNSRIADCIEIAGGLNDDADINDLNLAQIIEDGMKIYIPKKGEESNIVLESDNYDISKNGTSLSNKKININTANQTELESLPGIGPSIALKIIEYRKQKGKFSKIEDLKNVSGIGEGKYVKIKDFVFV